MTVLTYSFHLQVCTFKLSFQAVLSLHGIVNCLVYYLVQSLNKTLGFDCLNQSYWAILSWGSVNFARFYNLKFDFFWSIENFNSHSGSERVHLGQTTGKISAYFCSLTGSWNNIYSRPTSVVCLAVWYSEMVSAICPLLRWRSAFPAGQWQWDVCFLTVMLIVALKVEAV